MIAKLINSLAISHFMIQTDTAMAIAVSVCIIKVAVQKQLFSLLSDTYHTVFNLGQLKWPFKK